MTTVYAVSTGEYSDYGIECIFSTKEKAQEYIKLTNEYSSRGDFNDIEEFELDPSIQIPHIHKFKHFFWGEMDKDGNLLSPISKTYLDIRTMNNKQENFNFSIYHPSSIYGYDPSRYPNIDTVVLNFTVNANNEEHAQKIMGEKRSKLIRENRWPKFEDVDGKSYKQVII